MSGRKSKRKGYRGENEFVKLIPGAKRRPLSGSHDGGPDVELPTGDMVEVKRRKDGWKEIYRWLEEADMVAFRADRKEWIVAMRLRRFLELTGGEKDASTGTDH